MEGEDDSASGRREGYQLVAREITKFRHERRRAHIENVQIAIASLIVGSYFTDVAQSLDPISNIWFTDVIILVSVGFLLTKLVALSSREWGLSNIERITGSGVAPSVFTMAILGYFMLLLVRFSPIRFHLGQGAYTVLLILLAIIGVSVAVFSYWRSATGLAMYAHGLRDPFADRERVLEMVGEFPDVVEEGLTIMERDFYQKDTMGVDFIGEDANGKTVAIEVKWLTRPKQVGSFDDFRNQMRAVKSQFDRALVVTNVELNQTQKRELQRFGIECTTIDVYQVFGILSGVVRWFDDRFNQLKSRLRSFPISN